MKRSKTKVTQQRNWNWRSKVNARPIIALPSLLIVIASLLPACGGQAARSEPDYFIAPTLSGKRAPISLDSPTPPPATATPDCQNDLEFVEDVTIPDGSFYLPGKKLEKIWLVKNSGTCNWGNGYLIRLVSGDPMGAETTQGLYPARSGSEVEIKLDFTAPSYAGSFQTMWQAFTSDGEPFGEPIYMLIEVDPEYVTNTPEPTGTQGTEGTPEERTTPQPEAGSE